MNVDYVIVADDSSGLIALMSDICNKNQIAGVTFFQTFDAVCNFVNEKINFTLRLILDNVFEGEQRRGIELLEFAYKHSSNSELFLLTGKSLEGTEAQRIKNIGIKLIDKLTIKSSEIVQLFTCGIGDGAMHSDSVAKKMEDAGELSLLLEKTMNLADEREKTIDFIVGSMIEDIVSIFDKASDPARKILYAGNRRLSIEELRDSVIHKRDEGLALIKLHYKLFGKGRRKSHGII